MGNISSIYKTLLNLTALPISKCNVDAFYIEGYLMLAGNILAVTVQASLVEKLLHVPNGARGGGVCYLVHVIQVP